jgi:DNA-binding MarR family transcriptional regulator
LNKTTVDTIKNYFKAQRFLFLAEQCLNLTQKALMPLLRKQGINHPQYLILMILHYADISQNKVISTDLSHLLGLQKHSITPHVDTLLKKGFLERQRNTSDRRAVFLKLTGKGKALIEKIQPRTFTTIAAFPKSSKKEYEFLIDFLESFCTLSAENSGQAPGVYREAYERLLVGGQEAFLKKIKEENPYG